MTAAPSGAYRLARRGRAERKLARLLRDCFHAAPFAPGVEAVKNPACRDAFAALAESAREVGLEVMPPAAPFLSEDERTILGALAQAQRVRNDVAAPVDAHLRAPLRWCAIAALAAGIALPQRAVLAAPNAKVLERTLRSAEETRDASAWLAERLARTGANTDPDLAALAADDRTLAAFRRSGAKAAKAARTRRVPDEPSRIV